MASWTAPKYDWVPNDGIANTDFNRIEENTQYLYDAKTLYENTIVLSGSAPATTVDPLDPNDVDFKTSVAGEPAQWIRIHMPAYSALYLADAKYFITADGSQFPYTNRLVIFGGSTEKWESSAAYGDEQPNILIYVNSTAVDYEFTLQVKIRNLTGGYRVSTHSGWTLKFYKDLDTLATTSTTEEPA